MLKFDILHHTRSTPSTTCMLCTPQIDAEYRTRSVAVAEAKRALDGENERLAEKEDMAKFLKGRPVCVEMVATCRELQRRAAERYELRRGELERARAAIEDCLRRFTDKRPDSMDEGQARFYYGPTTQQEREVMSTARRAPTFVSRENEYIVDWTVHRGGRHTVKLYGS